MPEETSDIYALLLNIKEENDFALDDQLIRQCYELHKKHQYDRQRTTVNQIKDIVERALTATDS